MDIQDIILIGFDLDIIDLAESKSGLNLIGYTDKENTSEKFDSLNLKFLGDDESWFCKPESADYSYIMGMNTPQIRRRVFEFYHGREFINLISDKSYVSKRSLVGSGTIIQNNCNVLSFTEIGKGCLLNVGSSIHHESRLGDFSILAPGAIVLGRVEMGSDVYIGAGAIIKEGVIIGSGAYIGAGAVVIDDIPENSRVVGVPARKFI